MYLSKKGASTFLFRGIIFHINTTYYKYIYNISLDGIFFASVQMKNDIFVDKTIRSIVFIIYSSKGDE